MNSKERIIRTLEFDHPDRIPVQSWILPDAYLKYGNSVSDTVQVYASDFYTPDHKDFVMGPHWLQAGEFTDGWGCGWNNLTEGIIGEVKHHPIQDYRNLSTYNAPYKLLHMGWENVDSSISSHTEQFILTPWSVNIFERMQFLHGTEALLMDLAEEPDELYQLLEAVSAYYTEWLDLWLARDIDGVVFSDDWGTQQALLVSPLIFRKVFKPCYARLVRQCKDRGKYVFFHSDGNIADIMEDFIEIGVDAINCQTWLMGIERIAENFKGRITFWGELDRQSTLPFGTPDDVRQAAQKMKSLLASDNGGLIGVSAAGAECPIENIIESLKCWNPINESEE